MITLEGSYKGEIIHRFTSHYTAHHFYLPHSNYEFSRLPLCWLHCCSREYFEFLPHSSISRSEELTS